MKQLALSNELRMSSVDLCDLINKFREEEGNRAELLHRNLMRDIRREVEILENAGIEGQLNFEPSSYINSQNKKQPCYSLNRDGALQILNKESALVRYKTIQYIDKLEKANQPSYMIDDPIERARQWIKEQEEKKALQLELDKTKEYYSIKRVANKNNISWRDLSWRKLKHESELQGKKIIKVPDTNYDTVNTYHRDVWEVVYPELRLE